MGRARRSRPAHLASKLRRIRLALCYTQKQMFDALQDEKTTTLYVGHIALFEGSKREPDLLVLLRYARVAGVSVEMLIDDELELPSVLPAHSDVGISRKPLKRNSGKRLS